MNIQEFSARTTIGFLGAGQLARMSSAAAFRMGFRTAVYSGARAVSVVSEASGAGTPATAGSGNKPAFVNHAEPLELMTPLRYDGLFDDEQALVAFARNCDVVTLENEFLDGALLDRVQQQSGTPMYPSPESFMLLESKWLEKETFRKAGIPVTPYARATSMADLRTFADTYGYPFVLKSSKGGYDGYGNVTIKTEDDLDSGFTTLGGNKGRELICEAFVPFEKELAVQVARNKTGSVVYPCCESIQQGHICKTVISPAHIPAQVAQQARALALKATEAIDGIGLFAYEFFLTRDGHLLLNESAPRPHNTGHYTIEGCATSQFENHIRAVLGLPLGATDLLSPVAVMENILGTENREARVDGVGEILALPNAWLHIYGKHTSRKGRKMGHLTMLGKHRDEIVTTAKKLVDGLRV